MTTPLPRAACLAPEEVDMFMRGEISGPSRDAFALHLGECAECRLLLSTLARLQTRTEAPAASTSEANPSGGEAVPPSRATAVSTELQPRPGSHVGRYTVLDCLGAGGMGVVYRAHDPELARRVALKVLRADLVHPDGHALQARLRREAQAMAQMAHPNVVTIHDIGMWGDRVFIAMELVEGQNLSQWLALGPRSWRDVVAMFMLAGRGLMAAHVAGLVHRDFKPANVMVGNDGRVRVGDFGLAAISTLAADSRAPAEPATHASPAQPQTVTGSLAGTPYYMAPEQIGGEPATARSDQFSFCVALHTALTGEHPLTGERIDPSLAPVARAGGAPSLHRARSAPRWLQPILQRGLSVDPADRYPSMAALLEALGRGPSRRPRIIAACMAAACAVIAIAVLVAGRAREAEPAARGTDSRRAVGSQADDPFVDSPDVRKAFDREWRAMHTDACESPRARCVLQATNLLRDAGFDHESHAWQASPAEPDTALSWIDGHVRLSVRGARGAMVQSVPWLIPPRRSYRFSVWVRVARGQPPARGQLSLQGSGRGGEAESTTSFRAGADWSLVAVTLTSSTHHRGLRAAVSLAAPGVVDIDHAELTDAGLIDASFEDAEDTEDMRRAYRAANWVPYNLSNAVYLKSLVTDAFDGLRALEVRTTMSGGSIAQDTAQTPLIANTYIFTAWLRAGAGASVVDGNLALWALGKNPTATMTGFKVGRRWTRVQASLNIDTPDHAGLRAEVYLSTVEVPLEIDGTSLTPAGLVDASFEDEPVRWLLPMRAGTPTAVRIVDAALRDEPGGQFLPRPGDDPAEHAKDGEAWLRMTADQDDTAVAQEVALPLSGTSYTFSAWVRAAQGSPGSVTGRLILRGLGGTPEAGHTAFEATREWRLVTTTLTIRHDDHAGLRVEVLLAGAGTQLDIDGTSLTGASPLVSVSGGSER